MGDDLIICTRNRPGDLARCLASVLAQTRVPTRTTIVDSSDDDASRQVVEKATAHWPFGRALGYVPSRPGLVHQRVVGLQATIEPIVHFVDDDTVLEPGYVEAIVATFECDTAQAIGGVGGFVTNQPPHRFRPIDVRLGLDSAREGVVLPSGRNVRVYTEPAHDLDVDWLPGCAMSYRRSVLELEPPDERVGRNRNGEDVQLSYRVRQRRRLVVTPRARIAHHESPDGRRSIEELTTVELVSRWERVRAGTGCLDPQAFWRSAIGQLGWYGAKAVLSLSRERFAIARATWQGIAEIRQLAASAPVTPAPIAVATPPAADDVPPTERAA
jgi:GT2 family glycosyltransferase